MADILNKTINLSQTGLLYNPQLQDDDIVEKLFVVRKEQFELLLNKILQEKENSIPQHYLIIGQRGMGKTTLLKRMEVELHKEQYHRRFIPLLYREEQYNVKDLAEFWLNTLDALADSLQSEKYSVQKVADIDKTIMELSRKPPKIISEEAYKYLMEICCDLHRRPVLLIDNIGLIFNRLDNNNKNNTEQWALRKLLSENGAPIIVSGGVTLTDKVNTYGMPFFDFFQIQQLYKLNYEEFTKLLINIATVTNSDQKIIDSIQKNRPRQKSLHKLTGGSPRLAVMLFEQIAKGFSSNINDDLEILTDAITPLYKSRFEELPTQQQIILDAIALNWDAISLNKLSKATRMQNNQLSPQLKRLVDDGWIETTPAYKAKGNAYFISERFFNIYYLIRNSSRRHKDKVYCLSKFLECFYGEEDLRKISDDLLKQDIYSSEQMRLYLAVSMVRTLDPIHRDKIKDKTLKTLLKNEILCKEFDFSEKYFLSKGSSLFDLKKYNDAIDCFNKVIDSKKDEECAWCLKGKSLRELKKHKDALVCFNELTKLKPNEVCAWLVKGDLLFELERFNDALICFDKAIEINAEKDFAWMRKGEILSKLKKYDDAIECFDNAIKLNPKKFCINCKKTSSLMVQKRFEEAIACCSSIGNSDCNCEDFWDIKSICLLNIKHYEEAIICLDKAIGLNPQNDYFWQMKGYALLLLKHYEEAKECYKEAIRLNSKNEGAWFGKGNCLYNMQQYKEAVICYNEAIKIKPDVYVFWNQKGNTLIDLQYFEEAIDCFDKAIEIDPKCSTAWSNKGYALIESNKYSDAVDLYKQAIEINSDSISSKFNLIFLYRDKLSEIDKAIELFNSIDENRINENKNIVCRYHLHKALFELHKENKGLAMEYLLQAFEILEKEDKISSIAGMYWWIRFGSVVIKLDCSSWLISILEEKGYNIILSPYYTAMQALEIEHQDGKEAAEIYLNNRAVEISNPAKEIIEKMKRYML